MFVQDMLVSTAALPRFAVVVIDRPVITFGFGTWPRGCLDDEVRLVIWIQGR